MGEEHIAKPILSLFSDLSTAEKNDIVVRLFILFIEDILNGDYKRAALWICSRYSVVTINMRDNFSAGGKITSLDNHHFSVPVPQVIGRIYRFRDQIINLLRNPDIQMIQDVTDCWDIAPSQSDYLSSWLNKVNRYCELNPIYKSIDILALFSDML